MKSNNPLRPLTAFIGTYTRRESVSEIGSQAGEQGLVSAFAIDPTTHELTYLNASSSHGSAPCHIAVAGGERYLLVSNYVTGSLCILPIVEDGRLGEATDVRQLEGSGPHTRQEGPHAHMMAPGPDARFIYAVDLGSDRILIFRLDADRGKLIAADPPWGELTPGAGPRQITFHPNGRFAYTINELASTVSLLQCDARDGSLQIQQTMSTLPGDFTGGYQGGENLAAEIQVTPSGNFLFASNRGHNSIVSYAIDQETGRLSYTGHEPTQGAGPRHFTIAPSGAYLWVANQDSDSIVAFRIDSRTGKLTATGNIAQVPTPVCIRILNR
jgi:6-phosphogluconolactonase